MEMYTFDVFISKCTTKANSYKNIKKITIQEHCELLN